MQIDTRADGSVAVVMETRPPGAIVMGSRMAPAVAMHNTQSHGGGQSDDEGHSEIVYDYSDLFVPDVMG